MHITKKQDKNYINREIPYLPTLNSTSKVNWADSHAMFRDRSLETMLSAKEAIFLRAKAAGKF